MPDTDFRMKFIGKFVYNGLSNKILYPAYFKQDKNDCKKKNNPCNSKTEYFNCFFYTFGLYFTKVNNKL